MKQIRGIKRNLIIFSFILAITSFSAYSQEMDFQRKTHYIIELQEKGDFNKIIKLGSDEFREKVNAKQLQEIWESLQKELGTYTDLGEYTYNKTEEWYLITQILKFENKPLALKITFNYDGEITGYFYQPAPPEEMAPPPEYSNANLFEEKDMEIEAGDIKLPAKLTIPKEGDDFPLVILVHGSGPNDMDQTIGPNKIFRDIAWGLSSNGIAVIRYDKRTYLNSGTLDHSCYTLKEKVENDVHDVISAAKSIERIDYNKIIILGHSLGGLAAPRIAENNDDVSGLILMGVNSNKIHDVIERQYDYLLSIQTPTEELEDHINYMKEKIQIIREQEFDKQTPASDLVFWNACFWLDIINYEHVEVAANLKQPIIVLQGERDYQIPMREFYGWRSGLSSKNNVSFKWYPGLNHLFIHGTGEPNPEEYSKPGNVHEDVIKDIVKWIDKTY